MGNGEDSGVWGSITNTNWNLMEQAVSGVQTITMANANYTLTNLNGVSDEARNMVLVVQGTNSAIYQVIIPLNQPKMYVVSNQTTGGYAITVGSSTGAIITIPNGVTAQVYTDGTNTYSAQTGSAGNFNVNGTLTASGVTDTGNLTVGNTLTVTGASSLNGGGTSVTPTSGDNSTKIATTAFVNTAVSNAFPSGTRLVFAQASAPTGWTQDTSDTANNRMMRVVNTTGGGVGGSYDPTVMNVVPSHTHGWSANTGTESNGHVHTGTTDYTDTNHTHFYSGTTGSMNANNPHSHGYPGHLNGGGGNPGGDLNGLDNYGYRTYNEDINHGHDYSGNTGYMNQNQGHTHTFTSNGESANHYHAVSGTTDNGSSQTNWTPRYNNVIICQKN